MEVEIADPNSIHILQLAFKSLRKISEDIIMNISSENLSFRSVNSSRSALPVINFHQNFFKLFKFNKIRDKIVVSVPATSIIMAFKKALSPITLKMFIKDVDYHLLFLTLVDKYGIAHNWEFPVSDSSLISAVVDLNETTFQIKCRNDVFNGISDAFRSTNTIILDIKNGGKNPNTLNFKTSYQNADNETLSSTLTFYKCEKCDTIYSDDIKEMQISFFLQDFIVGIKLAGLFAHFLYLYVIAPGQPIVIKSSSSNMFEFEMPLATTSISKNEEYNDINKFVNSERNICTNNSSNSNSSPNYQNNINYSTQSQVTTWQNSINETSTNNSMTSPSNDRIKGSRNFHTNSNNDENKINLLSNSNNKENIVTYINNQKELNNSEKTNNDLFEASPPFPFKRKIISQKIIISASQPLSDEEDFKDE